MSLRIGVLVSGEGSNLQALIDAAPSAPAAPEPGAAAPEDPGAFEIVCVGSNNPDARALERAKEAGIERGVFAASDYESREVRDAVLGDWLDLQRVELVVLAGFMELLRPDFVRRFAGRIVNVHPSLLPAFPGLRPIEEALDYGVRVMGVTVHFIDEGVDSGPIILQEAFDPVPYSGDIAAVERRVHEIEHRLLPRAVRLIAAGRVRVDPAAPRRVIVEGGDGDD